jgi:hypothetical protein
MRRLLCATSSFSMRICPGVYKIRTASHNLCSTCTACVVTGRQLNACRVIIAGGEIPDESAISLQPLPLNDKFGAPYL